MPRLGVRVVEKLDRIGFCGIIWDLVGKGYDGDE